MSVHTATTGIAMDRPIHFDIEQDADHIVRFVGFYRAKATGLYCPPVHVNLRFPADSCAVPPLLTESIRQLTRVHIQNICHHAEQLFLAPTEACFAACCRCPRTWAVLLHA